MMRVALLLTPTGANDAVPKMAILAALPRQARHARGLQIHLHCLKAPPELLS
jgi:hypothetical protein